MTTLKRRVRRVVPTPRREYVVVLEPHPERPTIEVREKGRRRGYCIPVGALYVILAARDAEAKNRLRKFRNYLRRQK